MATTTITSDNLKTTEQIPLADNTVDPSIYTQSTQQALADITNAQTQAQQNVDTLNQQGTTDSSSLASLQSLLGGKSTDIANTYKQQGVTDLYNQISDINAQATGLNLESQAVPIQTQENNKNTGATERGVAPQTAGALRINALKALSLGQQAAIASSQYDKAKNYADQIINAKYSQIEADINAKVTNLNALKEFQLTPAEEKLRVATLAKTNKEADVLANQKLIEQRAYDEKISNIQNNQKMIQDYSKYAMDSGQSDLVAQLNQLNPSSTTFLTDIAKIQGQIKNPLLALDIALKNAQITQARAQTSKIYKETGLLGEPTATEKKAEVTALKNSSGQTQTLVEKVNLINSILSSPGINSRVGTTFLTRKPTGGAISKGFQTLTKIPLTLGTGTYKDISSTVTGQGQQFAGGVHKLASKEFLDALINAKSQGATFGALTDREGDALRASATQLNDWEIKDKNGLGTGVWNIDEESFKKELENLKTLANKGIENANGSVIQKDEASILDSAFSPTTLPASSYFQ